MKADNIRLDEFFTKTILDTTIMLYDFGDVIEVYYRKPNYAFEFAYGLKKPIKISEALTNAIMSMSDYDNLFT